MSPRVFLITGFLFFPLVSWALEPPQYAVQVWAKVQASPPQIILEWPQDPAARAYLVYRKEVKAGGWGEPRANLPGNATRFVDSDVVVGKAYEYQIEAPTAHHPWPSGDPRSWVSAYGYICAGIAVNPVESRGKLFLVVDSSQAPALESELQVLDRNLIGDGWEVTRMDVSPTASPIEVKSRILAEYHRDPAQAQAVFLLGNIATPYSGDFNPDMHADHKGAWPADAYYGDMDGVWTDGSVHSTGAQHSRNHNVPGDGKFDQSDLPSHVELQVGRVDLSDLPAFLPRTETDLLRQYLRKNHNYRHKQISVERRGLVRDGFGDLSGDAPAVDAWRNFAPIFGISNASVIPADSFFATLSRRSYLWSFAGGGGGFTKADGLGSTWDFARNDPRTIFLMLHGSYFGDWDNEDNLLRAPLGTPGYILASVWTGLPHWYFHHMALGETIGFSTRLTQNNQGLYKNHINLARHQTHVALMGDPTLRLHPVAPPSNLKADTSNGLQLRWDPSPDTVEGYYVYRAASPRGRFTRLSRGVSFGTTFSDGTRFTTPQTYMVRAVKLEGSGSGNYFNLSQGIFLTVQPSLSIPGEATAKFLNIELSGNSEVVLRFSAWANGNVKIESSKDLVNWKVAGEVRANSEGLGEFRVEGAQGESIQSMFFRVRTIDGE